MHSKWTKELLKILNECDITVSVTDLNNDVKQINTSLEGINHEIVLEHLRFMKPYNH